MNSTEITKQKFFCELKKTLSMVHELEGMVFEYGAAFIHDGKIAGFESCEGKVYGKKTGQRLPETMMVQNYEGQSMEFAHFMSLNCCNTWGIITSAIRFVQEVK